MMGYYKYAMMVSYLQPETNAIKTHLGFLLEYSAHNSVPNGAHEVEICF